MPGLRTRADARVGVERGGEPPPRLAFGLDGRRVAELERALR